MLRTFSPIYWVVPRLLNPDTNRLREGYQTPLICLYCYLLTGLLLPLTTEQTFHIHLYFYHYEFFLAIEHCFVGY